MAYDGARLCTSSARQLPNALAHKRSTEDCCKCPGAAWQGSSCGGIIRAGTQSEAHCRGRVATHGLRKRLVFYIRQGCMQGRETTCEIKQVP